MSSPYQLPEPDLGKTLDWRVNNVSWTTAPFAIPGTSKTLGAGSYVLQAAVINYRSEKRTIAIPNATALFLSLSQEHHTEAGMWLEKCLSLAGSTGKLPDCEVFLFYERIMSAAIFACTALESFVNEEIPDAYVYSEPGSKFTRQFNKEQIERNLTLDVKLGDVRPNALNVVTPKGGPTWSAFVKLRELRDRIVHMKTKDRASVGETPSSIWNALLTDPLPATHEPAKGMIKHFYDSRQQAAPRWFLKLPF